MILNRCLVPTRSSLTWRLARFLAGWLALTSPALAGEARDLHFNRDIRPIFAENCFRCHGPELKSRKAKLRLDVREVAVEKEAIVPGKPEASGLIKRLDSPDPEEHMP